MDDLAQFDPRRRPWRPGGEPQPTRFASPLSFQLAPPVPLPDRPRSYEWLPRLGVGR